MNVLFRAALATSALLVALGAAAQSPGPVETRLEQAKVVRAADGREVLEAADASKPGDLIQYTATYRNTGAQPVKNLVATLPIPAETELMGGTEHPGGASASVDGNAYGPMPLKRKKLVQGKDVEETVPLREIRFLRWNTAGLAPGQSAAFSVRVKVRDDRSPPGSPGGRP